MAISNLAQEPVWAQRPLGQRKHRSGRYYGGLLTNTGINASLANDMRLQPFLVPEDGFYDRIVGEITALGEAGSLVRLGVYGSDPETGDPAGGPPIVDAGTIAGDGATGMKEITVSLWLPKGLVYIADVAQACPTTAPSRRGSSLVSSLALSGVVSLGAMVGNGGVWQQTGVSGALPSWTAGQSGGGATVAPKLWLRKA